MNANVGLFRLQLRTLGTHYHPTLDPVVLWTPSNDTSRSVCSDSLNLMPPAPLHLRTLWRYTNAVLIVVVAPVDMLYYCVWLLFCPSVCACVAILSVSVWNKLIVFILLYCNSSTVNLLAAHRPKSRRSSRARDRAHVQDGQGSVQPAGKGLDTQVRHVARCAAVRAPPSTLPASSSCIHRLFCGRLTVYYR